MKINEILNDFSIFTSNEEEKLLEKLKSISFLNEFNDRERFVIENLIRKSLVIKIGTINPKVIANEF